MVIENDLNTDWEFLDYTLVWDRDKWRVLVNTVMNLQGYIKCGVFLDRLRTICC